MKPYYNCPIKAAYMAKYFGVKLIDEYGSNTTICNNVFDSDYGVTDKAYIHPDSLHIFESMEGDFVYFKTLKRMFMISFEPTGYPSELSKESANGKFRNELTIIQRNNLPFITPNTEEL